MPLSNTNFQKSPYRGRGNPPTPSTRWQILAVPLTGLRYIVKGTRGHVPYPLDWSKIIFWTNERWSNGNVYITSHNKLPIVAFDVQEMSFSYTNFQKNLPTVAGEPPVVSHPPPVPSILRFGPLWQILVAPLLLEYVAKMHKCPCSPLIGVKDNFRGGPVI